MRCDDVIREFSGRTGADLGGASAEHVAGCPRCKAWVAQAARFDALWRATRPSEPASDTFDGLWSRVHAAMPRGAAPVLVGTEPRRAVAGAGSHRRLRYWLAPFAAAAAALALAFGPGLARRGEHPIPPHAAPVLASFEAEPGETLFIEISGDGASSMSQPPSEVSDTVTVAAELDIFNFMESQDSL